MSPNDANMMHSHDVGEHLITWQDTDRHKSCWYFEMLGVQVNTPNRLRPIQNGRHCADDIFKCFFLNENVSISINISLKFVPGCLINNIPALAPNRRQVIICTNDGWITDAYMRHSASMSS